MMAATFLLLSLSIGAIWYARKELTVFLWLLGLIIAIAVLIHHMTDTLKINW